MTTSPLLLQDGKYLYIHHACGIVRVELFFPVQDTARVKDVRTIPIFHGKLGHWPQPFSQALDHWWSAWEKVLMNDTIYSAAKKDLLIDTEIDKGNCRYGYSQKLESDHRTG